MTHQLQIQIQKPAQASSKAMFQSQKTETGITRTDGAKTMTTQAEALFTAADLIHSYSRAQAIADGVRKEVGHVGAFGGGRRDRRVLGAQVSTRT